jgi:multisubunit Na+/H+ antiporter MnhC subunit
VWSCLAIASGIGLLLQKFWAYRLTQVLLIINILTAPFYFFLPDFKTQVFKIIVGVWIVINGVILWYLSRKNIKEQFLEPALIEKLEKQKLTS